MKRAAVVILLATLTACASAIVVNRCPNAQTGRSDRILKPGEVCRPPEPPKSEEIK